MRKTATEASKRGLKRHMKNVKRGKRTKALNDFNTLVAYFKWVDKMRKQQNEMKPALLQTEKENDDE